MTTPPAALLVISLVVLGWVAMTTLRARTAGRREPAAAAVRQPTLDYRVPAGLEPAAVVMALSEHGYVAWVDAADPRLVRVHSPLRSAQERALVRSVIEATAITSLDAQGAVDRLRVRFEDET